MPRNGLGTYNLPVGNPVTSGTTIAAAWANTTMPDIANEITNSLSRDGQTPMNGQLKIVDGTVAFPGVSFNSESGTGMYRKGTNQLALTVNGNDRLVLTATNATFNVPISGNGSGLTNIPSTAIVGGQVTVTAGTGLTGGGVAALGSTVTLTNAGVLSVNGQAGAVTAAKTDGSNATGSWNINAATTSQRRFSNLRTDGADRGGYGNVSITGSNNQYAGIDFTQANATFAINTVFRNSGVYKDDSTWLWQFDGNGELAAGTVPWSRITGAPSGNPQGYITSDGRAYPRRTDGGNINFGVTFFGTSPTYILGSTDSVTYNMYAPSNMSVGFASTAPWTGISGRPTDLASFSNSPGYITASTANAAYFSTVAVSDSYQGTNQGAGTALASASLTDNGSQLILNRVFYYLAAGGGGVGAGG